MIRDFCKISKHRLIDEIKELRKRVNEDQAPLGVQPDTVDAIDHVRKIGNIGAHMETDINVIVDVDPNEAQVLIELAELLFEELVRRSRDAQAEADQVGSHSGRENSAEIPSRRGSHRYGRRFGAAH
jgi:hypothetical protein